MKLTDIFKFKLFERTDQVDMETVNENFKSVEKLFKGLDQVDNTADCDKNVASAKKAECDGNGKNISETYLKKAAVANNNTTTESGFALDARQANPNVDGSLAKQINTLNDGLKNISFESGNFLKTDGSRQFWNSVLDLDKFYTGIGLFNEHVANIPDSSWWLVISAGVYGTRVQVAWNLWDGSMYVRHADNEHIRAWVKKL